jgi:intracellular multiplication protein IcmO
MAHSATDPTCTVWQARADQLVQGLKGVLAWAREAKGLASGQPDLRKAVTLRGIAMISENLRLPVLHAEEGGSLDLSGMPDALALPLRHYLAETGGYDPALPYDQQRSDEPAKQHSYVLFTACQHLPGSLA